MKVIFIHGPPAAGKLTIASLLSEMTGLPLFHNHLTVDLVKSLFEFGSPGFIKLREEIWLSSFKAASKAQQSFIFTFNPENTVDPALIETLGAIIRNNGDEILFIELKCSDEEVLRRIGNDSRKQFGKLVDKKLYSFFKSEGGFDFPPLPKPSLIIDTEKLNPEKSAEAIKEFIEK